MEVIRMASRSASLLPLEADGEVGAGDVDLFLRESDPEHQRRQATAVASRASVGGTKASTPMAPRASQLQPVAGCSRRVWNLAVKTRGREETAEIWQR